MQERKSLYLCALLHDIGKFIERAKIKELQDLADCDIKSGEALQTDAHRRYSAAFVDRFNEKKKDSVSEYNILRYQYGNESDKQDENKRILFNLIRMADRYASVKRSDDATFEPQKYHLARLHSIFNDIILMESGAELKVAKAMHLGQEPLSCAKSAMFPLYESPAFDDTLLLPYEESVKQFLSAFEQIHTEEELLFLLEKYLHSVPAQTPVDSNGTLLILRPDINLYDHSRTTAAIALCLYDEWKKGHWKGRDADIFNDNEDSGDKSNTLPPPCILIAGDLFGIQDFIFNIPSKGAAKSLKGRSFFVQLLAEVCAQFLLDELSLEPVNLLYNGGGNFFILASASSEVRLKECSKIISKILIQSELSVTIAHVPIEINDFRSFSDKWDAVKELLNLEKKRKYQNLDAELVFGLLPQKATDGDDPFEELTQSLVASVGYAIKKTEQEFPENGWSLLFWQLGYDITFFKKVDQRALCFNDTNFEGKYKGFRFAVKSLPVWQNQKNIDDFKLLMEDRGCYLAAEDEENRQTGNIKTFGDLAGYACIDTGTPKIGILKMDVDNLGRIFIEGFKRQNGENDLRTPSRMMALSRSLKWFFEGYMNTLINNHDGQLYPIFSGGDDFFLVGSWNKVFDIALEIRDAFDEFVGHHPGITLSASLLVVDEHFPVSRFAVLAEERLHKAKYESLHKNSISVFGQNLTWEEFRKAKRIKEQIVRMIDDGESKAVIQKILNGCEGLEVLYERAVRFTKANQINNLRELKWFEEQKPTGEKVWRLAYYLRDLKNGSKELAQKLVEEYEDVIFKAMAGEAVNPMYIAVGARWAELATRKKLTVS